MLHRLSLCKNLNLTVNSNLAPSGGNFTIFLIIGPSRYYLLSLIHAYHNIVYEGDILKFSSKSMLKKVVLRHKIKNGQKTRVTLVFCFYHFYCKICPYEWFLFDIQHNTIVWGHDLSYYLPIKANIEGWNFRPFPKLY